VSAGHSVRHPRLLELRYEDLARSPAAVADRIADHAGLDRTQLLAALGRVHDRSVGRWRTDLDAGQLADVEAEAAALLRELGYADGSAAGFEPAVDREAPPVLQLGDDA
jgi:hypothetical protein